MSNFGESWRIDNVTAAYITRGPSNGQYQVLFERCNGELPAIEAIDWASPTVELLRTDCPGIQGLPAGCGFTVTDITYDHNNKSYTVTVQVAVFVPSAVVTVMTAVPGATAVTTPFSTVATLGLLLVQVTVLSVALSGATVAVRVSVSPT